VAFSTQPCAEIDSCDFLFLRQIEELDHQGLRLVLEEETASPEAASIKIGNVELADCHRVEATNASRIFEVVWKCYVAYSVRNESYARNDECDIFAGRRFRIYSQSRLLDFIGHATFVSDGYPGPIQHIGVASEDHIIDVVSTEEPGVSRIWPHSNRPTTLLP
jgi:hypothetical protein